MEHQHSTADLENIAKQLACPEGAQGIKTGELMSINNLGMTHAAIDALVIEKGDIILEIGHGNGSHIEYLLKKANDIRYFGADISETMITEARKINAAFIEKGLVHFQLTNGIDLLYADEQFDNAFTVNTLSFWPEPIQYLKQIRDVLKPNGLFALCFADKTFMEKLPFTPYGFTLYGVEKVQQLLESTGFTIKNTIKKLEQVQSSGGEYVERAYYVVVASAN
ncbi:16S rRNA (cytosine(1402)-N(4))-methyltransferase [Pedobacter sp. KBW01]|uniref:class I SAM-dependent methyltransferase n=1 Tax=Pedobacter sp. KBW01 TaxID=2153364 RepID=UPI000F5A7DB7|nr:class I SAM-dependent methyltransferase [Pedobacter sp. KBW01]RQO78628.1 16S rRNA (cytosine(1402)-N(4))-methyltransferase [Pedobacter sp. KBW01]